MSDCVRPLRRNRQLDAIFDYAKNKLIERSDFHTRAPDSAERQYLFMVYLYNRIFAVRRSCVCVKANRIIATISRTGKLNKTLRLRCPGNDWITKYCDPSHQYRTDSMGATEHTTEFRVSASL